MRKNKNLVAAGLVMLSVVWLAAEFDYVKDYSKLGALAVAMLCEWAVVVAFLIRHVDAVRARRAQARSSQGPQG